MSPANFKNQRKVSILAFLVVILPGSGRLHFNGLPLLSVLEVGGVLLLTTCILNREIKRVIQKYFSRTRTQALTSLFLISLVFLKLLLFVRFPLDNGFEACYSSTDVLQQSCEKSYNQPYYRKDDVNTKGSLTRIDKVLNFGSTANNPDSTAGASQSNWNLPFSNDYPRFAGTLIDRIPFRAEYGGILNAAFDGFIPVEFTGDLGISLDDVRSSFRSYDSVKKLMIPISKGRHSLRISYLFTDNVSYSTEPINGPYAKLFVGQIVRSISELNYEMIIKGWIVDDGEKSEISRIEVDQKDGKLVFGAATYVRPDVTDALQLNDQGAKGFEIRFPMKQSDKPAANYVIYAISANGQRSEIGEIKWIGLSPLTNKPTFHLGGDMKNTINIDFTGVEISRFSSELRVARSESPAWKWNLLLLFTDYSIMGLLTLLLVAAFFATHQSIKRGLIASCVVFLMLKCFDLFGFEGKSWNTALGSVATLGFLSIYFRTNPKGVVVGSMGAMSFVAFTPLLHLIRKFHGIGDGAWWGMMIFRSRDSDWLVYQGYAKQIFNSQSLNGGEDVFYFMPAMRYFVYIGHLIFGENDSLIALLSGVSLFVIPTFLALGLARNLKYPERILTTLVFGLLLILFSNQIILDLATATAAEVPAWLLYISATCILCRLNNGEKHRLAASILLAIVANFRPNYSVLTVWMFVVILIVGVLAEYRFLDKTIAFVRLILAFTIPFTLSLFHNLYYGSSFTLFTNISDPGQRDMYPRDLLSIFTNNKVRALVIEKSITALHWSGAEQFGLDKFAAVSLQAAWAFAFLLVIRRGRNLILASFVLLGPLVLLVSFMPFHYTDTPQRHFMMISISIAMAICGSLFLSYATLENIRTLDAQQSKLAAQEVVQ